MRQPRARRLARHVLAVLAAALVAAAASACTTGSRPAPTAQTASGSCLRADAPVSRLPTVRAADLPDGARDTIARICRGGPYPFDRDGITFENREGILPTRPRGYYREYTVVTPGSPDRGPRRIVAGSANELYYTDDHYDTFREVVP